MKRKAPRPDERRRRLADINLIGEERRLPMPRKGCLGLFGSLLALLMVAAPMAFAAVAALR